MNHSEKYGLSGVAGVLVCTVIMVLVQVDTAAATQPLPELVQFAYLLPQLSYVPSPDGVAYVDASKTGLQVACVCPPGSRIEIFYNSTRIRGLEDCTRVIFHNLTNPQSGNYSCHYASGTVSSRILKAINVSVMAPEVQYGLLGFEKQLQCQPSSNLARISTTWERNDETVEGTLSSISFSDEGEYVCEIHFFGTEVQVIRTVRLVVLDPPAVVRIDPLPNNFILDARSSVGRLQYTANSPQSVSITFNNKLMSDIRIEWYKNDVLLDAATWTSHTLNATQGVTELNFQPIRRSDAGDYRVEITNTNRHIPDSARTAQVRILVAVNIQPSTPQMLSYGRNSQHLTWGYNSQNEDDLPNHQIASITFSNGTLVQKYALDGAIRQLNLSTLIPATEYRATITGVNSDGNATSQRYTFSTIPAAPKVRSVTVQRSENDTIVITVQLHYIGGESITSFLVSYRRIGTNEWSKARNITAQPGSSNLEWLARMTESEFAKLHSMLELQLDIMNNNQLKASGTYREDIELPGAPKAVSFITSDYTSITLRVSLSDKGAQPLVSAEIFLRYNDQVNLTTNVTMDATSFQPGNDVDVVVGNLEEGTEYKVAVAVYNYGGRGETSQFISSRTLVRPPIPVYGIALVVVAAGILVVAVVVLVIFAFKKNTDRRKKARAYSISKNGDRTLSPSHPVLHPTGSKRITTPTSPSLPQTPSTATSVLSPTISSPPAFYPPPPLQRQQSVTDSHHVMGSHAHTFKYESGKYESGSSCSASVTQDDLQLDSVTQRYVMCSLPRSGEVTPQIIHTLDRMEGLRDHTPKLDHFREQSQTPYLHMDGRCVMSHDMLPSASSRSSRLGSADTNRSRLTGTSGLSSGSPFAQSSYSVNTTATGLTTDTMSTRDGLMFACIEANKTDV